MKKILLSICIAATTLSVSAQQMKTNGSIPSNYPVLKEASNEVIRTTSPAQRSAATTIFSEDFDGGVGQFTVNTDAGSPVSWQHTTVGHVGQYQTAALLSTTAGNGWMIADSDAFGSQGGAQEYSEMVSPVIDCSMYPNVVLQFEQMFRRWQADTCIVMTSIDGGLSWTGKYYINSTVDANGTWTATIDQSGTDNPDLKQLNLSDDIGGEANVMFKFVWQGIWDYGWQIDDVALIEQPNNDLILNDFAMNMSSTVLGTADTWRDFYGHVPANQVTDAEFSFAVYNFGISDQPNVTTTVASGAWTDSENYGTLEGDSSFVVYHANQYMPTTVGQHDFTFSVSSDSTDSSPINNNGAVTVFITDTLFNGFGTGEKLGSMGTGYFTDGSDDGFKMANMYELETADELTSVTLGLRTNGSTQAGALVQVTVFDTTGFFSAGIETPIIYSNFYTITASDTTTGFATIPIPTIYNGIAQDRNLAPGAYFVSVECYNSAGTNNIVILDDKTFPRGAWSSMIYLTGDQWYTNGDALWISANFGTWDYNSVNEVASVASHNAFPNPTSGMVDLTYNLSQSGELNIIVRDITGKLVVSKNEGSLATGAHKTKLDLSSLAEGVYTYELNVNSNTTFGKIVLTK